MSYSIGFPRILCCLSALALSWIVAFAESNAPEVPVVDLIAVETELLDRLSTVGVTVEDLVELGRRERVCWELRCTLQAGESGVLEAIGASEPDEIRYARSQYREANSEHYAELRVAELEVSQHRQRIEALVFGAYVDEQATRQAIRAVFEALMAQE